ncbi:MAG: TonB-dependent receptor, partial [Gammaproteobacteria bacterium]|nr:TonB-dependent receptor [Gammaproteobacteria bacterium]
QKFGYALGGNCWFEFGDNRSYREPTQTTQFFANATWDVSDTLTLKLQGFRTRLSETTYTSTSNPGNSRIGELPAVRGEIPGNPFFAMDANGDGIPDRGSQDLNGDGTPDYLVSGIVNNGIPLREDVQARRLRPINKSHTPSNGHAPDMDNLADSNDWISRYTIQADFDVPFIEGWEGFAAYTHNDRKIRFMSNQNYDIEAMKQGLNCDVANDRDACYNPFYVVNQADNNSIQVMDDIAARDKEEVINQLDVIDIVINGEISPGGFELPGGVIGAAIGYQYREDYTRSVPSSVELAGDTWIGGTAKENIVSFSRDVDAFFAEVALPLLPDLELTAAVRREEFSTGQASTDPKYGLTYAPTDWLTLRATYGDAFIAPSLPQLLNPVTCGLSTVTDRFTEFSAFTTACSGGNPNLTNETSTSSQFGFDLAFDDVLGGSLDLSVTWNNTEFVNRIVGQNAQQKMQLEFFNFQQATGFSGSGLLGDQPTRAQLEAWLADPRSDKDFIRDPNDIATILQVNNLGSANAESVEVTAYDIQGTYRFSMDNIGDFRIGLQATVWDEFLYQDDPAQPIVDGAGNYNDVTGAAPSIPKIRANLTTGWTRGNHSVVAISRYVDKVENYDGPTYSFMRFFGGFTDRRALFGNEIRTWTQMDLNYTYRGLELFEGEMSFTLGSRNVFDREAQATPEFAGVAGALQDPMGRVVYARVVYDF